MPRWHLLKGLGMALGSRGANSDPASSLLFDSMLTRPRGLPHTLDNDTDIEPHRYMNTPCRIWKWAQSRKRNNTYGHLKISGKTLYAHRFFYEQANGKPPEGAVIDHVCERTLCCEPKHLVAVSISDNGKAYHDRKIAETRDDHPW